MLIKHTFKSNIRVGKLNLLNIKKLENSFFLTYLKTFSKKLINFETWRGKFVLQTKEEKNLSVLGIEKNTCLHKFGSSKKSNLLNFKKWKGLYLTNIQKSYELWEVRAYSYTQKGM